PTAHLVLAQRQDRGRRLPVGLDPVGRLAVPLQQVGDPAQGVDGLDRHGSHGMPPPPPPPRHRARERGPARRHTLPAWPPTCAPPACATSTRPPCTTCCGC